MEIGKKVIIVGAGLVGCEAGLNLARQGHEVIAFDMASRVANESCGGYRYQMLEAIHDAGMKTADHTKCLEIRKNGVLVQTEDGKEEFWEADTIYYALGMESNDVEDLKRASAEAGAQVYVIGDCSKTGKIGDAMTAAFNTAMEI